MAVTKVILAKLSPTMEEGTIVKWSKNEGDAVKPGDVLAEIETDKANMEMEALGGGVLRKILVPAGGKAPVGALIGVIADAKDDIAKVLASAGPAAAPAPAAAAPAAPAPAPPAEPAAQAPAAAPAPTPAAQPQAQAAPQAPAAAAPTPPAAPAAAAPAASAEGGRVKASPLARSMAAERNIPLGSIPGSGPGGRIIKRDIEAWAQTPPAAPAASTGAPAPAVTPGQELPLSSMRKTIARRLTESKVQAPHFYVTVEIDMDAAAALREQIQRSEDTKVSFNDLIVKAAARALRKFPAVNASWGAEAISVHGDVHVGVAVAINDGLIVPVVRNADRKSILEISREVKDLATRARDRKLKPEEFSGGTFSISNLGMFDVTEFTAIINPPESAILAVGAVKKVPVVKGDQLAVGQRMRVTLSSDHRVIDGALAAQFLAELRRLLENPVSLFI
jgi:pyruvate dehydrogenase E2 component (dihydrolipoamide acetyltransferase)